MDRMASLCMYMAIFLLTWSSAVKGAWTSRAQLCRDRGFQAACKLLTNEKPCEVLRCGRRVRPNSYQVFPQVFKLGVPDGTDCGQGRVCQNKKCIRMRGLDNRSLDRYVTCRAPKDPETRVKSRFEQCRELGFDVACEFMSRDLNGCSELHCGFEENNGYYHRSVPTNARVNMSPKAGTWCEAGKACYEGQCVPVCTLPDSVKSLNPAGPEILTTCRYPSS